MHQTTIQPPPDLFAQHEGLRGPLRRIRLLDKEARSLARDQKRRSPSERERKELGDLRSSAAQARCDLALPARRAGLIQDLRSLVVSEASRLPEILRHKPYRQQVAEWNLLKQAALMAFDGSPSIEYEVALSALYDSPEWMSLRRERDRIRTRARQKEGWWDRKEKCWRSYWDKPSIKKSKRVRTAAKRAGMTKEERDETNRLRREAYTRKMERSRQYEEFLGSESAAEAA